MEKQKKPFYKKWWFWVVVILVMGAIGSAIDEEDGTETAKQTEETQEATKETKETKETEKPTEPETEEETEPEITYTKYQVSEMMEDLKSNALKADDKYNKEYVEITGELSVIDSGGKYISLTPSGETFAIIGVQCYIKNDTQKSQVMEMTVGDTITLKGKIKNVGEVLGYSLDIDEIVN